MQLASKHKEILRYILAGGLSFVFELAILVTLKNVAGLSATISTAIAFWFGLAASFLLQKIFAFKDYEKTLGKISKQIGSYMILVGFNYIFTILFVSFFPEKYYIYTRTIALILTTCWNYLIYKKIIFKTA
jgi:putative flippase GtrA